MAINLSNVFDYTITVDNKDFLDPNARMNKITIKESVNKVPEISFSYSTDKYGEYYNNKDIEIAISKPNGETYRFNAGIYNIIVNGNSLVDVYGYGCKVSDFKEVGSAYLGDDLDTAIKSLGIKDSVEGIDKITGGYWQINETKLDCLYRLIKGAKNNSAVVISNDAIKVIDYSKKPVKLDEDTYAPTKAYYLDFNEYFNTEGEYYKEYTNESMYNTTWRDMSYVGYDHIDFARNVVSSIRNSFIKKLMIKLDFVNMTLPYNVGDYLNVNLPNYKVGAMCIIGKTMEFTPKNITTTYIVEDEIGV